MNFKCGQAPYTSKLDEINEISVNPNGDVIVCSFPIGNINKQNIFDILYYYDPYNNPCDICHAIAKKYKNYI